MRSLMPSTCVPKYDIFQMFSKSAKFISALPIDVSSLDCEQMFMLLFRSGKMRDVHLGSTYFLKPNMFVRKKRLDVIRIQ